ncbi:MAG TPA: alpha/beta fold hydrolase [Steroidobacteraceae bacterium]|nr:alpha/beta fold hydrolase [Steroidobacteraceae bacterium]
MLFRPNEDFSPPRWLRNRHVQSMLASMSVRRGVIARRAIAVVTAEQELLLDCGEGVRLQCFRSRPERSPGRPAVILHGWEGSAQSLYILSLAQQLFERGFEVLRLNLRDHGETHHLNRELFHSCRLSDVVGALRALQQLYPGEALQLAGFSLGGNFLLRAAAQAAEASLRIGHVVAVSPVLDPAETLVALEQSFPGYQRYFVRKWLRSLWKKQAVWPGDYDFRELARMANLRRMTAELVRRFTEFPSLEDYLNGYALTGSRLARLEVPARIITSLDDPIIPARGLQRLARASALRLTVTRHGGHCGFLERFSGPTWVERRIVAEFEASPHVGAQPALLQSA